MTNEPQDPTRPQDYVTNPPGWGQIAEAINELVKPTCWHVDDRIRLTATIADAMQLVADERTAREVELGDAMGRIDDVTAERDRLLRERGTLLAAFETERASLRETIDVERRASRHLEGVVRHEAIAAIAAKAARLGYEHDRDRLLAKVARLEADYAAACRELAALRARLTESKVGPPPAKLEAPCGGKTGAGIAPDSHRAARIFGPFCTIDISGDPARVGVALDACLRALNGASS